MSQPAAAASASRADSSAVCTPRRRYAGTVAAPPNCAMPSPMRTMAPPARTPSHRARQRRAPAVVALDSFQELERELLVRRQPLRARVGEPLHDDVPPGSALVRTAQPDLDAARR